MEKDIDLTCKALQASFLRRHFASLFLARQVICHTWSHTSGKRPKKRLLQPSPSCGALISAFQPFHFLELCKKRNRKLGNPWFFKVFPPFFPILNPSLLRPINRMPWPRRIAAWSKSCLAKAGELQIADCPTGHRINIDMDIDYHIYIYTDIQIHVRIHKGWKPGNFMAPVSPGESISPVGSRTWAWAAWGLRSCRELAGQAWQGGWLSRPPKCHPGHFDRSLMTVF